MYAIQRPVGPSRPMYYPQQRTSSAPPRNFHGPHRARPLTQPLTKFDGLALLAHCFGFQDASYLGIPKDVVFVAHDFEAYTPAHSGKRPVTEAGVAFFDTRVLNHVGDPGQNGENWLPQISAAHLRVEDRGHLINRHWAQSCGHEFDFGHSQWVPIDDMKNLLDRTICIQDRAPDQPTSARDMSGRPATDLESLRNRNVVLVSHAFHNDDGYMKTPDISFDYNAYGTVVAIVDTQVMGSRQGFEGMRFPSLRRLCGNFNVDLLHPHNAGNDAAYTMITMVLLALEYAHLRGYRTGRGPTNAAAASEELMKRCKTDYIRYWLTNAPKPGYRCEICGRKNSHTASECELRTKCDRCGCYGHREDRCQPEWMENAKLGYGNPTNFTCEADKIKHEFAAKVRAAALAAKAPVPLAANGHTEEAINTAFPLLPGASSDGAITAPPSEASTAEEDLADQPATPEIVAVIPTGPSKDVIYRTESAHSAQMSYLEYQNGPPHPKVMAAGQCVVTSAIPTGPRASYALSLIDGNGTVRRGRKKNWTKLDIVQ